MAGEAGQSLMVVVMLLGLLAVLSGAAVALTAQGLGAAANRANRARAFDVAEAGLSQGIEAFTGSGSFPLQGTFGGGGYTVQANTTGLPAGQTELESQGTYLGQTSTVSMVLQSPFFEGINSAQNVSLSVSGFLASMNAFGTYGSGLTTKGNVTSSFQQVAATMPSVTYSQFANEVGTLPARLPALQATLGDGWYTEASGRGGQQECPSQGVTVPSGVVAGVIGDLTCPTTIDAGGILVVSGDVQEQTLSFWGSALPNGGGGGLLVAGGEVTLTTADLVQGGSSTLAVFALDASNCSAPGCVAHGGKDDGNDITIENFAGLSGGLTMNLVLYAAPLAGATPTVSVNLSSFITFANTILQGALVSAGNVSVSDQNFIGGNLQVLADPQLVATFLPQVAGTGVVTAVSWQQGSQ